jgi:TIR domain
MGGIFISLTHADSEIAEAIKDVTRALLGYQVKVEFSTSGELDSGIRPGEDWIAWIGERVRTCDFVLPLITPTSARKPWILWELGAVYGAATATRSEAERKIRPLLYRVGDDDIPSPLRDNKIQYKRGDNRSDIIALFTDIVEGYKDQIPDELYRSAITLLENERTKSLDAVSREVEKSLQELKDSRSIIGAYFRVVDAALTKASLLVAPEHWHHGLFQNARYPITGVLVLSAKSGDVADATIQEASSSAEVFYGFPPNSGALVGKKITDLLEILKAWVDPDDFEKFVTDQKSNAERFAKGMLSSARVPIVFNDRHPNPDLHGKKFLPFGLHLSQGGGGSFMTILYLDLKELPPQLIRQLRSGRPILRGADA